MPPIGTDTPPYYDYSHSVGSCIIGGMRYRGALWNNLLGGKVLFGDHIAGIIWSIAVDPGGTPVPDLLADGFPTGNKVGLANFCTDAAGEIYLINVNGSDVAGGTIRRLVSAGVSVEPPAHFQNVRMLRRCMARAVAPLSLRISSSSALLISAIIRACSGGEHLIQGILVGFQGGVMKVFATFQIERDGFTQRVAGMTGVPRSATNCRKVNLLGESGEIGELMIKWL